MTLNKKLLVACFAVASFGQVHAQSLGTITGQVGVQMVIGAGCTITNGSVNNGVNQWGTLDFGEHADLSNAVNAQVAGTSGGNIQISCSTDLTPTFSVNSGSNFASSQRFMKRTGESDTIAYSLYSDSARTQLIGVDQSVSIAGVSTGTPIDFPLYGRVAPGAPSENLRPAGIYNDTLLVTLAW